MCMSGCVCVIRCGDRDQDWEGFLGLHFEGLAKECAFYFTGNREKKVLNRSVT